MMSIIEYKHSPETKNDSVSVVRLARDLTSLKIHQQSYYESKKRQQALAPFFIISANIYHIISHKLRK